MWTSSLTFLLEQIFIVESSILIALNLLTNWGLRKLNFIDLSHLMKKHVPLWILYLLGKLWSKINQLMSPIFFYETITSNRFKETMKFLRHEINTICALKMEVYTLVLPVANWFAIYINSEMELVCNIYNILKWSWFAIYITFWNGGVAYLLFRRVHLKKTIYIYWTICTKS